MTKRDRLLVSLLLIILIASCAPNTPEPSPPPAFTTVPQPTALATATATSTTMPLGLYRAPEVPDVLVTESDRWDIPLVADPSQASLRLELASAGAIR